MISFLLNLTCPIASTPCHEIRQKICFYLEKCGEYIRVAEANHEECQEGGEPSVEDGRSSAGKSFPGLGLSGLVGTADIGHSHMSTVVDSQAHAQYHDDGDCAHVAVTCVCCAN